MVALQLLDVLQRSDVYKRQIKKSNSLQSKLVEPKFRDIVLVILKTEINTNSSPLVVKEYISEKAGLYWVRTYPKDASPVLLEAVELLGIALACYDTKGVLKWQRK